MEIKTLSATFGRLENKTLPLSPGLNVIEAGNESGKTTWMAFLRVMLYGLNTRDRSPRADKHRYLPWSGAPMQGRMDLIYNGENITIRRSTARVNSPMGAFAAEYTDTTTPVPDLTSASLGETLLGVPQDVFERSAFIRQSGVPIDQSASLERRIVSLITTGEEDSSYTDAADRLRKQLNRRRYNKTGLLPQLESEISALEATLSEIDTLETAAQSFEAARDNLLKQDTYLRHQLELLDAADNAHRAAQLNAARRELDTANIVYNDTVARIAHLPSRDELTALTGEFSALETMRESIATARARVSDLSALLEQSQQQLDTHPFAPQTPEEAASALPPDAKHLRFPYLPHFIAAVFGAALFCVLRSIAHLPLLPTIACAVLTVTVLASLITRRQKLRESEIARKNTARQETLAAYTTLYREVEEKRAAHRTALDTYRTLSADYELHLSRILACVQRFHPVHSLSEAQRAVENAVSLYAALGIAMQTKKQAQLRFDLLSENTPDVPAIFSEAPALSRSEVERGLADTAARLSELQRNLHTTLGRSQALGDPLLIRADLEQKRGRYQQLTKEYEAISLAQTVLDSANTAMQNRFSPALGEKAANIFTKLTKGKYNKVLLDRKLIPSTQESGGILSREVHSLSQGTADQLYLAVRLAICDLVLPAEKCVPIFLDDALVTFDDTRMAAALDLLVELSEHRQILLFTCQQRELAYLRTAHPGRYHAVTLF